MQRQPKSSAAAFLHSGVYGATLWENLRWRRWDKPTSFEVMVCYIVANGRWDMAVYLEGVVLLNTLVDFLLILATNQLTGAPKRLGSAVRASILGGVYAGFCLLPEFRFLNHGVWQTVFLGLLVWLAFGWTGMGFRRGVVFVLLTMTLGGLTAGTGLSDFLGICICAGLLWVLCRVGLSGHAASGDLVAVELNYRGRHVSLAALRDTGNTLRDPLTGEQVLVCGADVGEELTGISQSRFAEPAQLVLSGELPGIRLISYRTVGLNGSLLPVLRLRGCVVNGVKTDPLVAFAPEIIGGETYRMLTGGITV